MRPQKRTWCFGWGQDKTNDIQRNAYWIIHRQTNSRSVKTRTNHIYSDYLFVHFTSHISATWLVRKLTSLSIDWLRVGLLENCPDTQKHKAKYDSGTLWRMKCKCNVHVNFTLIQLNFGHKQLRCWHSFNLKFICQGAPPSFCPFSLYFFHFRCFNLVHDQNPMFVLGVPIRQKTEVSQQKFVQKHSHQQTFSWFQSVPGKSGHAELVCTDTQISSATPDLLPIQLCWISIRSRVAELIWTVNNIVCTDYWSW